MKRICVFSDSHGCPDNMIRVMEQENPDMVIHLGDGEGDLVPLKNRYPRTEVLNVRGNCDGRSAAPMKLVLRVEQVRLFAVHGHEYNVKFDRTLTKLRYSAMEAEANVVLFGHTQRLHHVSGSQPGHGDPESRLHRLRRKTELRPSHREWIKGHRRTETDRPGLERPGT